MTRSPEFESDPVPDREEFLADVLAGLSRAPYALSPKYLYDQRGSELFDRICELEAYYPTRTELAILEAQGPAMAERIGPDALVVELGSGSSNKTRALLDHLDRPAAYIPVEIARNHLGDAAERVRSQYPHMEVVPLCADYTRAFTLPRPAAPFARTLFYFPGSTIGNFDPPDAQAFMARLADLVGPGGGLLIGVDLVKDAAILERAYDDPEGVTAAFNRNLLTRLQHELEADLDPQAFVHRATFNAELGCVEMHLLSLRRQSVRVGGQEIPFDLGQSLRTERSYKYTLAGFEALAEEAGWTVEEVWTDPDRWFSVQLLRIPGEGSEHG
ncbi:L-histidine N(alpha)-methyltransferase [Thiohalorhabdus sp.]|uniref:L-histidine N(alpha)-methyltransferase n=1 Tax=Thiohalorhabdus sp. TaxID=3094134 RepID=UPI002FC32DD7